MLENLETMLEGLAVNNGLKVPRLNRQAIWPVFLVNVCILGLALGLLMDLKPEDRVSIPRGCLLSLLGFMYFLSLYEGCLDLALSTASGARFRTRYRLGNGDVMDICNKVVSAVQAAFSCITGAIVCLWSCTRDFVRTSHVVSEGYAWFGAAYFFYDIYSMYTVYVYMKSQGSVRGKLRRLSKSGEPALSAGDGARDTGKPSFLQYCRHEPVILMHHLFIGGFGFLVIVYLRGGLGDCVFGFVYLMELSTPFVSVRGILSRLRLKASRAYLVNGVAMLLTFFLCRVLSLPYVCLMYSRVVGLSYLEAIKSLPLGCKVSICILLLPQLYWFGLMARGAFNVFLRSATPARPSPPARPGQPAHAGQPARPAPLEAGDTDKRS